ncbi:MAG: glycosyltransferase family 1 protein [Phycisphaera sp.]|nr:MAG: glycosyltransferase family 1 protein [Phycisphaera sp.]
MSWCFVSREFPPFSGGGIGTYARAITQSLVAAGKKPVVITVGDGLRTEDIEEGVVVVRLPLVEGDDWSAPHPNARTPATEAAWNALGPHSVFAMQVADVLSDIIDRHDVDLVEFADTGAAGWFALNRRKNHCAYGDVRMITNVHSPSAWIEHHNRRCEPGRQMHELQRMEREQAQWSDAVITPSEYMSRWVRDNWGIEAKVMRNPLPAPVNAARTDEEGGVLFVGRLEYRKGIDTLCRAWAKLKPEGVRLHLVGQDTPDERSGVPIGERLLSEMPREASLTVVEHGRMSPESVRALQDEASVVVVPSPEDNFPYTCVEAMAAGRVVVASDIGGAAELIDDGVNGFLFESGNCESLAITLKRAIDMRPVDRNTIGDCATDRVQELCNVTKTIMSRTEHADGIEHWRDILSDPECTALNTNGTPTDELHKLCEALTNSGSAFAIGWPRVGKRIVAHGTPSYAGLLAGPREVGPVVIRKPWLEKPEIAQMLGDDPSLHRDGWKLLAAICAMGGKGAVVPECVLDAAEPGGDAVNADVHAMMNPSIVMGEPGLPVGRANRLAPAFEGQTDTVKSRVMGTARKLLGG